MLVPTLAGVKTHRDPLLRTLRAHVVLDFSIVHWNVANAFLLGELCIIFHNLDVTFDSLSIK